MTNLHRHCVHRRSACRRGLAVWTLLLVLLGAGPSAAQTVVPDSKQVRPERIDRIRQRIDAIRQTGPARMQERTPAASPVRTSPRRRAPSGLTQADLDRLEVRVRRLVEQFLTASPSYVAPWSRVIEGPGGYVSLPPDTVRVPPDTVRIPADTIRVVRDSVRTVRDTLRTTRVETIERSLLDTGVFRAFEVNFAFGTSTLQDRATRTLDAVGAVLERHADVRVEVAGHTDAVGPDSVNQRLSRARARAVRTYLLNQFAIDADRLVARGYGEARPVASNDTPTGRALNRRVEFVVRAP